MSTGNQGDLAESLGESHAHTSRFSDGPRLEDYISGLTANTVGIVDHVSPEELREIYRAADRNRRWFIENGELRNRSRQIDHLETAFPDLQVLKGAEIDTFPGLDWTASVIEEEQDILDYAHVSTHYVPREADFIMRIKDSDYGQNSDTIGMYLDALDETVEMLGELETDIPLILSHPGLAENNPSIPFDSSELANRYENLLDRIDGMDNVYPELNLKTEERKNCNSVYQLERLLDEEVDFETTVWADTLMDYGTEYAVGSDVHRPEETDVRMRLGERIIPEESLDYAVPIREVAG